MNNTQNQKETLSAKSNKPFQLLIKRIIDVLFSLIVLIILIPVFLIVAILIILEDGRPVLFKQRRSGKDDTAFEIYKFRSMRVNQSKSEGNSNKKIYDWKNGVPDDFVFKLGLVDDPNITKVGKIIRKYSLDELPQFYNVLIGNMSVIGPRPELIDITRCYNKSQKRRLDVKPGITGFAQANGRSEMNHGEKIRHDLYYVENFSLWLDFKVLFKTIIQVAVGKGAF